jgi:hypothetical protein
MRRAWGSREIFTAFHGRPEGKRPLGRPRSSWVYNIKVELVEMLR